MAEKRKSSTSSSEDEFSDSQACALNAENINVEIDNHVHTIENVQIEKRDIPDSISLKPTDKIHLIDSFKDFVEETGEKIHKKIEQLPLHFKNDKVDASVATEHHESENEDESNNENIGLKYALTSTQDPDAKFYNMNHKYRGVAIIFNQNEFNSSSYSNRIGSKEDVKRLQTILPQMGFEVLTYEDLTYDDIQSTTYKVNFEKEQILEESACIMVFILTHGAEGNKILARDCEYDLYKYVSLYTPNIMKTMAGKPKLFFIQACRGTDLDSGVILKRSRGMDMVDSSASDKETYSHPVFADLLIAFSSHQNHFSFRNEFGSWFIQELCNVLEKCDFNESDITDILSMTNKRVAQRVSSSEGKYDQKKQISAFYSTLVRKLYFSNK